jgi:hypothetical protein
MDKAVTLVNRAPKSRTGGRSVTGEAVGGLAPDRVFLLSG